MSFEKEVMKIANYFIIHGFVGKPFENWFPWLEKKLSENNLQCIVPQFPTPLQQSYVNWEKLLNYYKQIGFVDKNTVFVAHSLGPIFVAKYVIRNNMKIKGLISISGFNNLISGMEEFDNMNKSFFLDNSELSKFKEHAEFIHCFISKNDPHLPINKLMEFVDTISGELHVIPSGGHFNTAAGYVKFDEVYNIIKTIEGINKNKKLKDRV